MGLYLPDFRAQERVFQLLAQVAGRAGRGFAGGEVLIQTFSPFNPAIIHATGHDYLSFAEEELEIRKELLYPPYSRLCALHFEGDSSEEVLNAAQQLVEKLQNSFPEMEITEPMPAPVERIKGKYRFMSVAKGETPNSFRKLLRQEIMDWRKKNRDVIFYADIDALNLL
jgi:primosomal protein N' (replication factor Y)